jgi:hypothetical protein
VNSHLIQFVTQLGLVGTMLGGLAPGSMAQTPLPDSPNLANPAMQSLPNVEDLSDLTPDHWAYKYVKNLNDRYNLLTGYPDSTFRGNQPFTRYEFVAVLAKVFERAELFQTERQEDLDALNRLAAFYRTAIGELRTRMNGLDERHDMLTAQNFSGTTKLQSQVVQTLTNGTGAKLTAMSRLRLKLNSSFTGRDRLITELEFGTNGGDAISLAQSSNQLGRVGLPTGGLQEDSTPAEGRLRRLYYEFPVGEQVNVAVGTALPPSDFIDRNGFANNSGSNFASPFFANNPLIVQSTVDRFGGPGVSASWQISRKLALRGLSVGSKSPDPKQTTVELEYKPAPTWTTRWQYTHARVNDYTTDAFGLNSEWAVTRTVALFGRYGIGQYRSPNGNLRPHSWMVGATLRNFLLTGSKAGLGIGQPFAGSGLGNATQTNAEGYFSFLLNDQINLIPSLQIVSNPDNQKSRTIWQWAIRMVIDF